ncbi:MAG TPA: L,D-transpeptidase family protein [Chryseosolibacter sp.]
MAVHVGVMAVGRLGIDFRTSYICMVRLSLGVIILAIAVAACTTATKPPVASEPLRQSAVPLTLKLNDIRSLPLNAQTSVQKFYEMSQFTMVWMDSFAVKADADSLVRFINRSEELGLVAEDYHSTRINTLMRDKFDHQNAAAIDALLTDSFITLWYHLKNGRVEKKTFARIKLDSLELTDAREALKSALATHSITALLRSREPQNPEYSVIKNSLVKILQQNLQDTTVARRRDQLIASMERWRWEPPIPKRYIAVNVPSFQLKVVEDDSIIMQSRVIIGKPETPTPNIKSVVQSFIIYPYWHVPRSILKEILPSVQADTNYLRKHNYQVIDSKGKVIKNSAVDWKKYTPENFPYVLRQREGSENTMGVIKFVFPNNYGVYLHDTNARRLFAKSDRALSHGCIRVQKAVDLAKYLAKDDDTYVDAADLEQYLMVQKRLEVKIVRPIPVHLNYFTVEQEGDTVKFYKDLYKKDRAMVDSINRVKPLVLL